MQLVFFKPSGNVFTGQFVFTLVLLYLCLYTVYVHYTVAKLFVSPMMSTCYTLICRIFAESGDY